MEPQFFRSALVVGRKNIDALMTKKVAVLGVGGVGSFAVEALARMGVGKLLLVDNDVVDVTNINRQLQATHESIGAYKTLLLKDRVKAINPFTEVETKEIFVLPENISATLPTDVDYILDALDTVSAKIAIAEFGVTHGIPTISCMGAGNKVDPTQFRVGDLYETSTCPLCRVLRKELRKRGVKKLKVVYSTEAPSSPRYDELPLDAQEALKANGRRGVPGSVSFVPPVVGMIAAGEIIKDLMDPL